MLRVLFHPRVVNAKTKQPARNVRTFNPDFVPRCSKGDVDGRLTTIGVAAKDGYYFLRVVPLSIYYASWSPRRSGWLLRYECEKGKGVIPMCMIKEWNDYDQKME